MSNIIAKRLHILYNRFLFYRLRRVIQFLKENFILTSKNGNLWYFHHYLGIVRQDTGEKFMAKSGETDLQILLKTMRPTLRNGEFVFCSVPTPLRATLNVDPVCEFKEEEGITLILLREQAEQAGLAYQFPARMITLMVHSSLNAVGFLAVITGKLAGQGISVNAVSAYFHDHLFVPLDRVEETMKVLVELTE
jgi:hypothetical protein